MNTTPDYLSDFNFLMSQFNQGSPKHPQSRLSQRPQQTPQLSNKVDAAGRAVNPRKPQKPQKPVQRGPVLQSGPARPPNAYPQVHLRGTPVTAAGSNENMDRLTAAFRALEQKNSTARTLTSAPEPPAPKKAVKKPGPLSNEMKYPWAYGIGIWKDQ